MSLHPSVMTRRARLRARCARTRIGNRFAERLRNLAMAAIEEVKLRQDESVPSANRLKNQSSLRMNNGSGLWIDRSCVHERVLASPTWGIPLRVHHLDCVSPLPLLSAMQVHTRAVREPD